MRHNYSYQPGARLAVWVNGVWHEGIASNGFVGGEQGVISASLRAGRVAEEPLRIFAADQPVRVLEPLSDLHPSQVVANARRAIGQPWHLTKANCQHRVCEAFGVPPHSPQLWIGAGLFLLSTAALMGACQR